MYITSEPVLETYTNSADLVQMPHNVVFYQGREYARGRPERRDRFRPDNVAFFSSESDKNFALIFRKVRCLLSFQYTHVSSAEV